MIDFSADEATIELVARLQAFLDTSVSAAEEGVDEADFRSGRVETEVLPALRKQAQQAGVYAPQLPAEFGGLGLSATALALVAERCGPHPLGALAINCMAPNEANMDLLVCYGTSRQHREWLIPLAAGEIRSCFAMTEPDAGSDPRRIRSTATRLPGGGWRLDGHKVFTSGGIGAHCCVFVAVSESEVSPGQGLSMFIVPTRTNGFEVVRDMPTMGNTEIGGIAEVRLTNVRVGAEALLGHAGAGFAMAQSRLGTGRIGHAMRWIGIAQRCIDLAAAYSLSRITFGQPLAERQAVQWWLADAATLVHASRLMVLHACWKIDRGLPHRTEVAMIKTFVAEALGEIVDKALQVHGGWGYTADLPFERWYRDARGARLYDGPSEVHRMAVARRLLQAVKETGSARAAVGDLAADSPADARARARRAHA